MSLEGKQFGHYRVLQLIGKGGMGEVYLAEDVQIVRQVAVKVIRIETVQPDDETVVNVLRHFLREATVIAKLDHPTILPLYDYGETVIDASYFAYLIIPYRPEGSLVTWLRQRAQIQQTRQLTLKQVVHVIHQAGRALQYAHDHQVMHLDVKPANFLIRSRLGTDDYPDLLLSDFGIARLANATSSSSQRVSGTPTYMAPEQCIGQPVFASDQYALAIMAYELVSGSPPFQGAPMSVMFAHLHEQPKPTRDRSPLLPTGVDIVLQRALAKKPEERFPSVTAFTQAFREAFQGMDEATTLRMLRTSPTTPLSAGDVRATLVISTQEARSGTTRTLDLANRRAVIVQIPPGVQSGQVFILIGQGEPLGQGNTAGNLYLTLAVVETQAPISTADSGVASPSRSPKPTQSLTPVPSLPMLPPITSPHTAISPQGPITRAPLTSPQAAIFPQNAATFSPPAQPTNTRSPFVSVVLILLILILLGGGSVGVYVVTSGQWPWATTAPAQAPGTIWHTHAFGTSKYLFGVAWSGSQFVAVGDGGTVLTSPDGSTWIVQNPGTSVDFRSVAWSGSQFVVEGANGTVRTSPDGSTWTSQDAGATQNLWGAVWSGSQFVVVGDNGTIRTSPNGHTWTLQDAGATQNLWGVTWSGSQFVVAGLSGIIRTSPNGHTWTFQNPGTSVDLKRVAWSGSQFVVVGNNGTVLTSPNGHTWTSQNSGTPQDLEDVTWTGSQFVVVGGNGNILTSP